MITSRSVLLSRRNVSARLVEEIETHFVFNNFFLYDCAVYEIMWKNTVEPGRPHMTIWGIRISRWVPKVTNTHS